MAEAIRTHPLETRIFAGNGTSLSPVDAHERISLRADANAAKALGKTIGLALPTKAATSVTKSGISALWIGPDEWLIIGEMQSNLDARLNGVKGHLYSAVPVDHRNTAISVSGPNAVHTLNSGSPRDLSLDAFPVGACSRTILGKSEIILWRTGKQEFHVECWRSFSDYVWKFLVDAARSA